MTTNLNVVTGATGMIGGHIAEQLVASGEAVRALVRPGSDTSFLCDLGVELAEGDLHDPASLRAAVAGADVVYHAAARVGDWGPWSLYQADIIDATRNVLDACRSERVGRLLHMSSLAVYGYPRGDVPLTEEAPLGQNPIWWDYYGPAKAQAEALVRAYGPGATIVRPGWTYGPRDRITVPRLIRALQEGRVPIIGSGENKLNILYVADVAEGVILAANHPAAAGRTYNLSSAGAVTQAHLLNTLTDALSLPRIQRRVPRFAALTWAFLQELPGRLLGWSQPPTVSRKAVHLVSRMSRYSTERARTELGWQPRVPIQEGVRRSLAWYFNQRTAKLVGRQLSSAGERGIR